MDNMSLLPEHLIRYILITSGEVNVLNLSLLNNLTNNEIYNILNVFIPDYPWNNSKYDINNIEWISEHIIQTYNWTFINNTNVLNPFTMLLKFIPRIIDNIAFISEFESKECFNKIIDKYTSRITKKKFN